MSLLRSDAIHRSWHKTPGVYPPFGHTVMDRALVTPHAVGADGGCCFGEELRCVIIPDWEIVTVPSQTKHLSKRNAATGEDVKLWNIHGSVNTFS